MSTRNLDALFRPQAIALVGASDQAGSVGSVVARNLLAGRFSGPIMLVNPKVDTIAGAPAFRTLRDLPHPPELAVIATPATTVPTLIAELATLGCRAAVVISAGFDAGLRQQLLDAARPTLMRIVGPNCLGFLSTPTGINASFSHLAPLPGRLALLTQSGAIATSLIDWGAGRGVGFSHVLSIGDMSDVDFGDLLDVLADDAGTSAILIYAESVTHARKFMSAARTASRAKPVIMVKAGRSSSGARAAASHTGALAGADAVFGAALRRAGILRVDSLRELFDAAETLSSGLRISGERLAIVTNGGGLGVMAADALESAGGQLAQLSAQTLSALGASLPASWSGGNPVDILGDAHGDRYEAALAAVSQDPSVDAILVMNCPTGVGDNREAALATAKACRAPGAKPMLACWMGAATTEAPQQILADAGIASHETPEEAVTAFLRLVEHDRNQRAPLTVPSRPTSAPHERAPARSVIQQALAAGRTLLTEPEAKAVLGAFGIPVVATSIVSTPEEAASAARLGEGPFALKILSRQISHKSDVDGVQLNLPDAEAVAASARKMLDRIPKLRPEATIDGFTLQSMVARPHAQELILGAMVDPIFGPCLLFGQGGVATEVVRDRAIGLPPLDLALAHDMIRRTRVARLLAGYRDRKPADLDAVARTLVALSDMMIEFPEIQELDINPLLADADGVIALDARVVVKPATGPGDARLAIRP